ncbi:hypothetical protein [Streptomyces sp. NBC_01614]|uniref:hypothetical protein n=1 Tax=Streptomyces sp. NBC_01614 TaxID=2975897 RepID=UPI0038640069
MFGQSATSQERVWNALNGLGDPDVWTGQGVTEELGSDALRVLREVADSYGITVAGNEDLASVVVAHLAAEAAAAAGPPTAVAYAAVPTTAPAPYTSAGIGDDTQLLQWCFDNGYASYSYQQVCAGVMAQWQFGTQDMDGWLLRLAARFGLPTAGTDAEGLWQAIVTSSTPAAGQQHPATAPPPATGHTATTTVYQNQNQAQGGDESDDSAVLGCVRDPQLQALTFDALAAYLAQWDFSLERVQHSLARIAYSSSVSLQGLEDWDQAWKAIVAKEQALSGAGQGTPGPVSAAAPAPDHEAMVDACLARRLPLHKALADISGTAHVQQIDVANYIIALARHRLGRTYTDTETAYHDLRQTVVPQPPPTPTRKRQRKQPDYAPWLLSAALSTDNSREIAQQAEAVGAPTTDTGIQAAIRVLGGKRGLQGTTQEIREQLRTLEHNGELQNPNLYIPAPAPPPAAQHMQPTLNRLTPIQQWLLSAALSTDNPRKIAQQTKPAGAPTTKVGIENAIDVLGGKLGLQGTTQEIRKQLRALEHNGELQNPNLYIPAPAPQPAAQHMQPTLNRLTPIQQWLLSAALSTDNPRKIAQQTKPAGAPTTEAGIKDAIDVLGGKLGLQGTTQEIRKQLRTLEHNGELQNPNLYIPAPAPQPAAQHMQPTLNRLTPIQQWLLSAALSTDNPRKIAQQTKPAGAPTSPQGIEKAIDVLGGKLGLQGTTQEIREQLRTLEHNGELQNPNLYRPGPAPLPAAEDVQGALDSLTEVEWWLLGAALSYDKVEDIAGTAARTGNGAPTGPKGIQGAIERLGKKLGLAGTAGKIREQLRQMEAQGIFRDPGTYR